MVAACLRKRIDAAFEDLARLDDARRQSSTRLRDSTAATCG